MKKKKSTNQQQEKYPADKKNKQSNCKRERRERRENRLFFILFQFTLLKPRNSEQCNEMMTLTQCFSPL